MESKKESKYQYRITKLASKLASLDNSSSSTDWVHRLSLSPDAILDVIFTEDLRVHDYPYEDYFIELAQAGVDVEELLDLDEKLFVSVLDNRQTFLDFDKDFPYWLFFNNPSLMNSLQVVLELMYDREVGDYSPERLSDLNNLKHLDSCLKYYKNVQQLLANGTLDRISTLDETPSEQLNVWFSEHFQHIEKLIQAEIIQKAKDLDKKSLQFKNHALNNTAGVIQFWLAGFREESFADLIEIPYLWESSFEDKAILSKAESSLQKETVRKYVIELLEKSIFTIQDLKNPFWREKYEPSHQDDTFFGLYKFLINSVFPLERLKALPIKQLKELCSKAYGIVLLKRDDIPDELWLSTNNPPDAEALKKDLLSYPDAAFLLLGKCGMKWGEFITLKPHERGKLLSCKGALETLIPEVMTTTQFLTLDSHDSLATHIKNNPTRVRDVLLFVPLNKLKRVDPERSRELFDYTDQFQIRRADKKTNIQFLLEIFDTTFDGFCTLPAETMKEFLKRPGIVHKFIERGFCLKSLTAGNTKTLNNILKHNLLFLGLLDIMPLDYCKALFTVNDATLLTYLYNLNENERKYFKQLVKEGAIFPISLRHLTKKECQRLINELKNKSENAEYNETETDGAYTLS